MTIAVAAVAVILVMVTSMIEITGTEVEAATGKVAMTILLHRVVVSTLKGIGKGIETDGVAVEREVQVEEAGRIRSL